jgi:hypothetical protein
MSQLRACYSHLKTLNDLDMNDAFEMIFKANDFNKDNTHQLMLYLAMRLVHLENRQKDLEDRLRFK